MAKDNDMHMGILGHSEAKPGIGGVGTDHAVAKAHLASIEEEERSLQMRADRGEDVTASRKALAADKRFHEGLLKDAEEDTSMTAGEKVAQEVADGTATLVVPPGSNATYTVPAHMLDNAIVLDETQENVEKVSPPEAVAQIQAEADKADANK